MTVFVTVVNTQQLPIKKILLMFSRAIAIAVVESRFLSHATEDIVHLLKKFLLRTFSARFGYMACHRLVDFGSDP